MFLFVRRKEERQSSGLRVNFDHLRHASYDRRQPLGVFVVLRKSYFVFCTRGVTLFARALHLNCTALSQSGWSIFFKCIISLVMACRFAQISNFIIKVIFIVIIPKVADLMTS